MPIPTPKPVLPAETSTGPGSDAVLANTSSTTSCCCTRPKSSTSNGRSRARRKRSGTCWMSVSCWTVLLRSDPRTIEQPVLLVTRSCWPPPEKSPPACIASTARHWVGDCATAASTSATGGSAWCSRGSGLRTLPTDEQLTTYLATPIPLNGVRFHVHPHAPLRRIDRCGRCSARRGRALSDSTEVDHLVGSDAGAAGPPHACA
ncbi:protein of unknown function [Streptantibioticus cattleyicolor NRRL 8057 = DSM 46488]|nr:protein of unknown function [Streptantibioticus cattleyicolor NRRL 8057 = DSM 46488]